jgi:hypothetical protein
MMPRLLIGAAACCIAAATLGCGGGGNVYVGVGVVGPYCCYGPVGGPYAGRPPYYWDDDDLTLAPLEGPMLEGYAAAGPTSSTAADEGQDAAIR